MELQQLRYVLAVAETMSFTRAAERCFVVQSALSHQVKVLERELGFDLFARTTRRVELTSAGTAFLPYARACLDAAEQAQTQAAAAVGLVRGTVTIGAIPTVTAVDLPALLRRFHHAHPEVQIRLRSAGSDALSAWVAEGSLDVAFLGLAPGETYDGVRLRELKTEPLACLLPKGHPLAGHRTLQLIELTEETFVDFPAASPARIQSDLAFERAGLTRDVRFEIGSTEHLIGVVGAGLGIGFLAPAAVPSGSHIQVVPLTDGPQRIEYVAWRDFNPSPAAEALLALI